MDTQTARERLEALQAELTGSAQALHNEHAGDSGELSHYDQHPADAATDLTDADREEAVLEVVERQLTEVREALARLDAGSYGRCVDCGQALPEERLDARPEAARCVSCQQRREGAR